jgi:uroporphyrinogen-III synthase
MRLLVTRPLNEAQALARALEARGHEVVVDPALEIVSATEVAPDLADVQALLATSANGVRAFAALTARRDLRLLAVGKATAEAAKAAGFINILSADGDSVRLALLAAERLDPKKGTLLHIVGQDTAGDLKGLLEARGFTVRRHVLYVAQAARALAAETRARLSADTLDGVLFFSPRSARIFLGLVDAAQLAPRLQRLVAFCLSPTIAEAAKRLTWGDVRVAARPEEEALLAAIEAASAPLKP